MFSKHKGTAGDKALSRFLGGLLVTLGSMALGMEASAAGNCVELNGRFISYYGDVYFVSDCKRYLVDKDRVLKISQTKEIVDAEGEDIQATTDGGIFEGTSPKRACHNFNGRYVTYAYTDFYYVENCTRRLLPDWETVDGHMRGGSKRGLLSSSPEVLSLTWEEFASLHEGEPIQSVLDQEYIEAIRQLKGESTDLIPQDEACEGIEGRYIAYYSRIYRVEKCYKRPFTAAYYTSLLNGNGQSIKEVSSQIWLSLPTGVPIELED